MSVDVKKIYNPFLIVMICLFFIGAFYYLNSHPQVFTLLSETKFSFILALLACHMLLFCTLAVTHKIALKKHKINIHFNEWFGLYVTSEMINSFLPAKSGSSIRLLYLKDKKGLSLRAILNMSFIILFIGMTFLGFGGLLYTYLGLSKSHPLYSIIEAIFISICLSGLILLILSRGLSRLIKNNRHSHILAYLKDKKILAPILGCWILVFMLYPLKTFLSFQALGITISTSQSFEMGIILTLISLFNVIPGNIGIKEAVTAYLGNQYGINVEVALMASLLDRATMLVLLLPFGLYFYWHLLLDGMSPFFFFARPKQLEQTSP